jgi:hypothetical protein
MNDSSSIYIGNRWCPIIDTVLVLDPKSMLALMFLACCARLMCMRTDGMLANHAEGFRSASLRPSVRELERTHSQRNHERFSTNLSCHSLSLSLSLSSFASSNPSISSLAQSPKRLTLVLHHDLMVENVDLGHSYLLS